MGRTGTLDSVLYRIAVLTLFWPLHSDRIDSWFVAEVRDVNSRKIIGTGIFKWSVRVADYRYHSMGSLTGTVTEKTMSNITRIKPLCSALFFAACLVRPGVVTSEDSDFCKEQRKTDTEHRIQGQRFFTRPGQKEGDSSGLLSQLGWWKKEYCIKSANEESCVTAEGVRLVL